MNSYSSEYPSKRNNIISFCFTQKSGSYNFSNFYLHTSTKKGRQEKEANTTKKPN